MVTRRRVFAIATDSAGCWHYRLHLPLTRLDPDRFEVVWRGPDPAELRDGDVVVGQRLADDNPAWRQIGAMDGVLAVYDIDDDLLNVDPANTVPYSLYGRPDVAANIRANMAAADVVTVSTPALAEVCREHNKNVVVLENCLARVEPAHRRPGVVTIGWAGSPFHAQDWTDADRAALRRIADEFGPAVRFRTIGADYMGLPNEHTGWSTMDAYWQALDFDIGIAPLADTPFNASKSWVKALEYMSRGVVPVVPAIGQYPELVVDEDNGLVYPGSTLGSLEEALGFLLRHHRDTNWLSALSEGALETAARWTIDKHAHRWETVYLGGST